MSIELKRNIDSYVIGYNSLTPEVITAGAGNDGVELDGNGFDRDTLIGDGLSASIFALATINVSGTDTVTTHLQVQDSDDGSSWADYGPAITDSVFSVDGTHLVQEPINLAGARAHIRVQYTFTLSAGATDTAAVAAVVMMSGFPELPNPLV